MREKTEDFVEDCCVEIDEEYEFDASHFFDFTKPELDSQIEEVERWFQVSGDDPHSPFVVKLDLDQILRPSEGGSKGNSPKSSKSRKSTKSTSSCSNNSDIDSRDGVPPSNKIAKGHPQKLSQSRSCKFMEPTASHLAKQNTTPKHNTFKDYQPTAKKLIMHSRSLPRQTKSKAQVTEFQEFHFKTSERAMHHSSIKENKTSTGETLAEKFDKLSLGSKLKTQSKKRLSANSKGTSNSRRSSRGYDL